jgi:hypothetical protein
VPQTDEDAEQEGEQELFRRPSAAAAAAAAMAAAAGASRRAGVSDSFMCFDADPQVGVGMGCEEGMCRGGCRVGVVWEGVQGRIVTTQGEVGIPARR